MASDMPSVDRQRTRTILDWITIGAFLLAISASAVDVCVRSDDVRGPKPELREAAPRPDRPADLWTLTEYPAQYESYFKDTFGLRDVLLRGHSVVKFFGYGVPPSEQVIVGQHGWLFYTGDQSVEVYRGLLPFSDEQLEGWRRTLEGRRDYLRARKIEYLFVIAPNKEAIYPEHMPKKFEPLGPTRLDQLVEYLRAHSDVEFLDLRPTLLEKKLEDVHEDWLYVRLGTHWNGRGSYESYRAIIERLSKPFPAMRPFDREDLAFTVLPNYGDTWGTRMYIEDLLPQRVVLYAPPDDPRCRATAQTTWGPMREVAYEKDDPKLPRALLFHDSFGPYAEELIARHFSSLVCSWRSDFDTATIERAQPDVVIEMFVERILVRKSPKPPPAKASYPDREAYESSSDVRWKLDGAAETGGLEPDEKTRVERRIAAGATCFAVHRDSVTDRLFVPAFDTRSARSLVMCAEIESPVSTTLTVLFLPPGETEYKHRHQTHALLRKGPNRVFLRLDPRAFEGRLFLHAGVALDDFMFCGLEIRAVD